VAYTSEIEKLEARYRENPKGRNFAPLADAYRKAGLIDNAIELCQSGLQLHPDYVSGHIVHGRCLVDKKDDSGAEAVFRRVLDLDPENILALKVLAEISERNERFAAAVDWLNRLLLADPMNGEAADGLSRVRGKLATQAQASAAEEPVASMLKEAEPPLQVEHEELEVGVPSTNPPDRSPQSPTPRISVEYMEGPFDAALADATTAAMNRPEFEVERTSEPPPPSGTERLSGELEMYDGSVDFNAVAPDALVPDGIQLEEPAAPAVEIERIEIEGLARTQYEGSGLFKLDQVEPPPRDEPEGAPEAAAERTTSPMTDLPLILPEDVTAPTLRTYDGGAHMEAAAPAPAASSAPPPLELPDDDGAADTATLSQAEPVVTETMAELYLQQGHQEDALRVYEALSLQRPHDARLRQKVAELAAPRLRSSGSGQSAGTFLKGILSARPGATPPPPPAPPAEPPTAPPPLLAVEPVATLDSGPDQAAGEGPPAETGHGSPTRPASDAISLDSVFGDEGGRGSIPALPEQVSEKPGKQAAASGGFSFDDFFGTSSAPAAGSGKGSSPNARPPRSSRTRGAEPEDDLDQFQAWLKSLKA
jgi:tetratricopeptide (TPR) repeat protein